jgi:hypothetical protein
MWKWKLSRQSKTIELRLFLQDMVTQMKRDGMIESSLSLSISTRSQFPVAFGKFANRIKAKED